MKRLLFLIPLLMTSLAYAACAEEERTEKEDLANEWLRYMEGEWEVSTTDSGAFSDWNGITWAAPRHTGCRARAVVGRSVVTIEYAPALRAPNGHNWLLHGGVHPKFAVSMDVVFWHSHSLMMYRFSNAIARDIRDETVAIDNTAENSAEFRRRLDEKLDQSKDEPGRPKEDSWCFTAVPVTKDRRERDVSNVIRPPRGHLEFHRSMSVSRTETGFVYRFEGAYINSISIRDVVFSRLSK
jgi:hypothetical protein